MSEIPVDDGFWLYADSLTEDQWANGVSLNDSSFYVFMKRMTEENIALMNARMGRSRRSFERRHPNRNFERQEMLRYMNLRHQQREFEIQDRMGYIRRKSLNLTESSKVRAEKSKSKKVKATKAKRKKRKKKQRFPLR